jgi:alpha-aminoadipate/glutamate carrier protein LysW
MPTSICPECSEEVFVDAECEQGDGAVCDECGASLVVVGLDPIELDLKVESDGDDISDRDGFQTYDFDDDRY